MDTEFRVKVAQDSLGVLAMLSEAVRLEPVLMILRKGLVRFRVRRCH